MNIIVLLPLSCYYFVAILMLIQEYFSAPSQYNGTFEMRQWLLIEIVGFFSSILSTSFFIIITSTFSLKKHIYKLSQVEVEVDFIQDNRSLLTFYASYNAQLLISIAIYINESTFQCQANEKAFTIFQIMYHGINFVFVTIDIFFLKYSHLSQIKKFLLSVVPQFACCIALIAQATAENDCRKGSWLWLVSDCFIIAIQAAYTIFQKAVQLKVKKSEMNEESDQKSE
ncbi:hypothetical protein FGO68_gene15895 [Halteria grandinella]|uniref:Transmembrane protein n=1 Tax=Halteria grandinella TaxID=5974 RepID=A0A8J8T4L5_HALGN|nr:hypothetical protein FGO68_gene15895 [Halteria grandinella]